jgi:hypothetical protein
MKTTRPYLLLAFLLCAAVLSYGSNGMGQEQQSKEGSSARQNSKDTPRCALVNRTSGYALNIRFPKGSRKIKVYNTDYPETHKHDPICLSKSAGDTIFWVSGSGKKFKLKVFPEENGEKCGQHPFEKDPTSQTVSGYYSDSLRPDVPAGCVYNVEFQGEGEKAADPHIQTTP